MAQNSLQDFTIGKLSTDDGLSQGSNYFRYEDSQGYMWLTANDALNRYDGSTVKVFNLNKYFKNCPTLTQGYGFAEDKESNIYTGSLNGMYKFKRKEEKFELINVFKESNCMVIGYAEGKVWCFNKLFELASYDPITQQINYFNGIIIQAINSMHVYDNPSEPIFEIYPIIDNNANIWFFKKDKISKFNIKSKVISNDKFNAQIKNKVIRCADYNEHEHLLYISNDQGIFQIDPDKNTIVLKFKLNQLNTIFESHKDLFILKNNAEIVIYKDNGEKINLNQLLEDNYYRTYQFGFDKHDRLWFCDDGLGQIILDFNSPIIAKYPKTGQKSTDKLLQGTGHFNSFNKDEVLINNYLLKQKNKKEKVLDNLKNPVVFNLRTITDIPRKKIWRIYANNDYNILTLDFINRNYTSTLFAKFKFLGNPQDLVLMPNGSLLLITNLGLFKLDLDQKKFIPIILQKNNSCFKINVLDNNTIAMSYTNSSMRIIKFDNTFKVISETEILPKLNSYYLNKIPNQEKYWVGTSTGMVLVDSKFKIIKKIDANSGLAGTNIYGLLLDSIGNAYCSHQRGLSSINIKDFKIVNFNKNDGIQDWDFNNKAFLKTKDGTMYFGGVSGFNYFKPPLKPISYYDPELILDQVTANNNDDIEIIKTDNNYKLKLAVSQNNLKMHLVIKDLINASKHEVAYKINTGDWIYNNNNSIVNFTNLAAGNYTMSLGVRNKFENETKNIKTLKFEILAPFYQKLWFYILCSIGMTIAVLYALYYLKNQKQLNEFTKQLELEKQRSRITADLHDDIGSTLSSLQINSAIAGKLMETDSSETKKILAKIEIQSKKLGEKLSDIVWSMKPSREEYMSLSMRIKNFANDMLDATNIDYKIKIDKQIDKQIIDFTLRKNILLIAKEAINNAAKYSNAKNIEVNLHIIDQIIKINVKDDGKGFDIHNPKGNGIANMKMRCSELKGTFIINSVRGSGTEIEVMIPLVT